MSNNNKRASKETSGCVGSKKKKQLQQSTLFSDGDEVLKGLNKAHIGKRLLIPAKVLYSSGRVPFGQEDYLFQYSVRSVNKDHKTLVIQYDEQCISTDSDAFQDFPLHDENEETIDSYQIKHLKEHHELYNIHLGRVNKKLNDKKEEDRKTEEAKKTSEVQDFSDLLLMIQNKVKPATILLGEFVSIGELQPHIISKGPNMGDTSYKQQWKHRHSDYKFIWHRVLGKDVFVPDKLFKAARAIIGQKCLGWERIELILKHDKKPLVAGGGTNG